MLAGLAAGLPPRYKVVMVPPNTGSDREDALSALGTAGLFRGLPEEDLLGLLRIARTRSVHKGETLFMEGHPSEGFFLVLSGSVKLYKLSPAGKEKILHVHGRGDPFAEATLAEGARYPATASATEDAKVLLFPRREFQRLISERPVLATNLIAKLSQRVKQMVAMVEDLSLREAPGRVARYLLDLAGDDAEAGVRITLPMRKGELASLLGTRQETLSRALRKLADARLIRVEGADVDLLDPEGLADVSLGDSPLL